ncbi:MAG: asparaginase domain-containing protein [Sphingobacterium sp.]|nr:asparaginase domain-containing protein [Sphingobacterium sp.]
MPIWTREAWYRELGLPADVVEPLAVSRLAGPLRGPGQGVEDRPDGRRRGPGPVPQEAEKERLGPARGRRRGAPPHLRPAPGPEDIPGRRLRPDGEGRPRRVPAGAGEVRPGDRRRGLRPGGRLERRARRDEGPQPGQESPRPDGPGHDGPAGPGRGRRRRRARPGGRRGEMLMAGDDSYKGYRGEALSVLKSFGAMVWSDVEIKTSRGTYTGHHPAALRDRPTLATSSSSSARATTSACLAGSIEAVTISGRKEAHYKIPEKEFPFDPAKPKVKLLGTGGTIASRLDYRTGAVIPAFSPGELYGSVPELADICNLETEKLFGVFSENMGPEQYIATAQAIGREIEKGVQGIVIGHGTDTMHHTAAILSFMVQDPPVPIVMVGSQRSSDRPSSDAALNLMHSVKTAAESDIAEVMVCMFGPTSDTYGLLHRGTRVRKMHSSYRSTFRTIGDIPIAMVSRDKITPLRQDYKRRRTDRAVKIDTSFEEQRLHRLLLPQHEAGHRRLAHRQRLPGHRHRRDRPRPRQQAALSRPPAGPGQGHRRLHDGPDPLGLRPDVRLRHGPRHDGARGHPGRQHAARGGLRQAGLGPGPDDGPRGGPEDHADAGRRGDHGAGAVQRLSHLPGRHPRGRGVHLDHQEIAPALKLEADPQPEDPRVEDLVRQPAVRVGREHLRVDVVRPQVGVVGPVDGGRVEHVEDVGHEVDPAGPEVEALLDAEAQVLHDGQAVLVDGLEVDDAGPVEPGPGFGARRRPG